MKLSDYCQYIYILLLKKLTLESTNNYNSILLLTDAV